MPAKAEPTNARAVRPFRVQTDPVVPEHAPCIVDGQPRPRLAVRHEDPFCTTTCCRSWYAVPEPAPRVSLNA